MDFSLLSSSSSSNLSSSSSSSSSSTSGTSSSTSSSGSLSSTSAADTSDRFLKLLVAQMQNQDPLNPMDNAAVTTQMAQIQTVSGIEKLNTSVVSLNTQFAQLQALSGAGLVGRNVMVAGNDMQVSDGTGHAGFELASAADTVKLEVLDSNGKVIDTQQLGAMSTGRHVLDWTPSSGVDATQASTYRITASASGTAVTATTYQRERVEAVSATSDGLTVETESGELLSYDKIKIFD